jgi:uncharacterized protein
MVAAIPRAFDFDQGAHPRFWNNDDAARTIVFDAFSLMFPAAESFMIRAMQGAHDRIADPQLRREVMGFVRQEAAHARVHQQYNRAMQARGFDALAQETRVRDAIAHIDTKVGKRRRMAASAGLEHFTTLISERIVADPKLFCGADERYRRLWIWHAEEEIEHRSVAFDVHAALYPDGAWLSRARAMITSVVLLNVVFFWNVATLIDGAADRGRVRLWLGVLWFVYGGPGFFRRTLPRMLAFFRPGFHPAGHRATALRPPARDISRAA